MFAINCGVSGHDYMAVMNRDLSGPDRQIKIDCEAPIKIVCTKCYFNFIIKCRATIEEKCLPCALRSKADKKLAVASGLDRSPMGWVELTLTAGGTDVHPWDMDKCNHSKSMKHSGKIGCRVEEMDSVCTNTDMPKDWNRLMQSLRRLLGSQVQYAKVFESQDRGLLHIHGILTNVQPMKIARLRKEITRLAKRHGFGGQISVKRVVGDSVNDRHKAVNYVAKYLTKGSKTLQTASRVTGEIRLGGYRKFTTSRKYGDSLKTIRAKRLIHFQMANSVGKAGFVECANGADTTPPGDEVALDDYKKSYTLLE